MPPASVAVFLASRLGDDPAVIALTAEVGVALARAGVTIVYGGASVGLMGTLADAALAAGGKVVGVLPRSMIDRELAHPGLTELHIVDGMASRKAEMMARAEAFLVLPGGFGTLDEMFEVLTLRQIGEHQKPVAILDPVRFYDHLYAFFDHAAATGLLAPHLRGVAPRLANLDELGTWLAMS